MTPDEQRVYDAYPLLSNQLVQITNAFARLPLDEMMVANGRLVFNGTVAGASHGMRVDVDKARRQAKLIQAAIDFRRAVAAIGARIEAVD